MAKLWMVYAELKDRNAVTNMIITYYGHVNVDIFFLLPIEAKVNDVKKNLHVTLSAAGAFELILVVDCLLL